MTRKRRRDLGAELGAGNDPTGVDSAEVETPIHTGKRVKRSSKATPKPTPGGKGKTRLQRDVDSDEEGGQAGPSKTRMHRAVRTVRNLGNLLTPESEGLPKDNPPEDGAVSSLKTPLAGLKLGGRRQSTESPLPQATRRSSRSSNIDLPTPIPSSRAVSKSKASNSSKVLARTTPELPELEPIIISSSPLSPLTDLPDLPDSPPRPQASALNVSPVFKVPALPLTPRRHRVENRKPDSNAPSHSAMAVDSDEGLVPTSQSQDLRPFPISPPRPGGSALFKDTTPKSLRQSQQGYITQLARPLPSILATIQANDHIGTQESEIVVTSQIEETELRIPRSVQVGPSRALAFSSPSGKRDKVTQGHHQLPSSERTDVLRTPTKITGLPHNGKVRVVSPATGLLCSPQRNAPARRSDDGPSTSPLPPSSIPPPTDLPRSSRDDTALDFVQYQTTPTKRRSSLDSPTKELKLFDSQTTHSPPWSRLRSFERWRVRDLLDSQRAFSNGKAGLEAEAEGREPGEGLKADGGESEELERAVMMASSMTEPESQDLLERLTREHPELKYAGKAPPSKSSNSSLRSKKSGSDSAKDNANGDGSRSRVGQVGVIVIDDTPPPSQNLKKSDNPDPITNRIENVGMVSSVRTQSSRTESDSQSEGSRKAQDQDESQSGINESALIFSEPSPDPLAGFLDIFEGASSMIQDSQSVIDIDD